MQPNWAKYCVIGVSSIWGNILWCSSLYTAKSMQKYYGGKICRLSCDDGTKDLY